MADQFTHAFTRVIVSSYKPRGTLLVPTRHTSSELEPQQHLGAVVVPDKGIVHLYSSQMFDMNTHGENWTYTCIDVLRVRGGSQQILRLAIIEWTGDRRELIWV